MATAPPEYLKLLKSRSAAEFWLAKRWMEDDCDHLEINHLDVCGTAHTRFCPRLLTCMHAE